MKYADLDVALPDRVLGLLWRDERLALLRRDLFEKICIQRGDFDGLDLDCPVRADFSQEGLSEDVKKAYLAIREELDARYGIEIPNVAD